MGGSLQKRVTRYGTQNSIIAFFVVFFFLGSIQFAEANHAGRFAGGIYTNNPCESGDIPAPGNIGDGSSGGRGLGGDYVPVHEVGDVMADINTIANTSNQIALDANAAAHYLRVLCEKEFELDHTIQHEWVEVMDGFSRYFIERINNMYGLRRPAYVTNPYVYYRNVALGVNQSMIDEITAMRNNGELTPEMADIIINSIIIKRNDRFFPDLAQSDFSIADIEQVDQTLADNMATCLTPQAGGAEPVCGWDLFLAVNQGATNNTYGLYSMAMQELENRQKNAMEVEAQKLAWGRGFFSNELCGQRVFSQNPRDVRTCEIRTPGALLQELSSLVIGSAVRYMENADEYEEWIPTQALRNITEVLALPGLRSTGLYNPNSYSVDESDFYDNTLDPDEARDVLRSAEDAADAGEDLSGIRIPKHIIEEYYTETAQPLGDR